MVIRTPYSQVLCAFDPVLDLVFVAKSSGETCIDYYLFKVN